MRLRLLAVAAVGAVAGSVAVLSLQGEPSGQELVTPQGQTSAQVLPPGQDAGAAAAGTGPAPLPTKTPRPTEGLLLAWTPGGLPAGLAARVAAAPMVETLTVVRGDPIGMTGSADADGHPLDVVPDGMVIPLDAVAVDVATYPATVPAAVRDDVARLAPDEVLLGATSARLRRAGPGSVLTLAGGRVVTVAGVVDGAAIGGAEVAFTHDGGAATGVATERALLVTYDGERAAVEDAVRAALAPGIPIRFRAAGETPFLRSGDAVLPQALVKDTFGEFAYRPLPDGSAGPGGRGIEVDPAWEAANIVEADMALLGPVRCHRLLVPLLAGAMAEFEGSGLGSLVDPGTFDGCWNPRLVKAEGSLSHHAWGAALDIGYDDNPTGVASGQDPRLVDVMARWGFTWGGPWLVPDPAHFEFLTLPAP